MKRLTWALVILAAAKAWSAPVTLISNGFPSNRVDVLFLGDGYTQADISAGTYDHNIQGVLNYMFGGSNYVTDPFPRYQKFFNVYKIDVVSNQSGADIPSEGVFVDTALGATYETSGIDRALSINNSAANAVRDEHLTGTGISADLQLVTVNHTRRGGTGTSWAVYAGGNVETALHEIGHTFANLHDEYVDSFFGDTYTGAEPDRPNVTKNSTGAKWSQWHGFHDPRGMGIIGAYEGALYANGIYRPSINSKMRDSNWPFNAVGREAIIHEIYERVRPLDFWLDNASPVTDVDPWVVAVDPEVIKVKWYVNNVLVPGATLETFHPADYGFGAGTYQVRAHAYDEIVDHSRDGSLLDLVRKQLNLLQQDISWTLTLTAPVLAGDYNDDGTVDAADYVVWRKTDGLPDGYGTWRANFGKSAGSVSFAHSIVPEPSTVSLLVLAAVAGCMTRRWTCRSGALPERPGPAFLI